MKSVRARGPWPGRRRCSLSCSAGRYLTALLVIVSLGLALAGCAAPRVDVVQVDRHRLAELHRAQVGSVVSWKLEGRMSIAYDGKVWRSGLNWFHAGADDRISLTTPGGRTVLRLENRSGDFNAVDSRGRTYRARSFEELVLQTFGIDVPLENLSYWVTGLAASGLGVDAVSFNENGSAKALNQGGWEVRYQEYQPVASLTLQPITMPSFLVLNRDNIKLTVAIKRWQFIKFKAGADTLI